MRPFHATPADRIAQTEARLGRRIWAARELPDDLARALWWKMRRRYFDDELADLAGTEDYNRWNIASDERDEARAAHRKLIVDMWLARQRAQTDRAQARMLRAANACADTMASLLAVARAEERVL